MRNLAIRSSRSDGPGRESNQGLWRIKEKRERKKKCILEFNVGDGAGKFPNKYLGAVSGMD